MSKGEGNSDIPAFLGDSNSGPQKLYDFDRLMSEAVKSHISGDYEAALNNRIDAYYLVANRDDLKAGNAARDVAATFDRMANTSNIDAKTALEHCDNADFWLNLAVEHHEKALQSSSFPNREEYRQISATEGQIARQGLHKILNKFNNGDNDPELNQKTYEASIKSRQHIAEAMGQSSGVNTLADQFKINFITTHSLVESELGNRKQGFWLGVQGVVLSVLSESKLLDTSSTSLSNKERFGAKKKSFLRGIGAIAVSVLGSKGDNLARKIA